MALCAEKGNFQSPNCCLNATETSLRDTQARRQTDTDTHTLSDTYQLACLPLAVERGNERGRQRETGEIQRASEEKKKKKKHRLP